METRPLLTRIPGAEVAAESWAVYGAARPYSGELQDYWQNRYRDSAQEQVDFDLDAYMAGFSDPSRRSVVAANTDMAAMAADILAENGLDLDEIGRLDFKLDYEGNLSVSKTNHESLTEIFNSHPDFVAAFKEQLANPPVEDVSAGSFRDGDRSLEYGVARAMTLRADEPSAVVMHDSLNVRGSGYTYVKKAGDYFDPEAGSYDVRAQPPMTGLIRGPEQYRKDYNTHKRAMDEALTGIVGSGERFEGTITRADVAAAARKSADEWLAYNDSVDWYSDTGEIIDHAGDGKHYGEVPDVGGVNSKKRTEAGDGDGKADGEDSEGVVGPEPAVYLEENDVPVEGAGRVADFRRIVAELNSKYSAIHELLKPRQKWA